MPDQLLVTQPRKHSSSLAAQEVVLSRKRHVFRERRRETERNRPPSIS